MEQQDIDESIRVEREKLAADAADKAHANFWPTPKRPELAPTEFDQIQHDVAVRADELGPRVHRALSVISQLGIVFAEQDVELAIEALGVMLVEIGLICTENLLSISPVIDLALVLMGRQEVQPLRAASTLASVEWQALELSLNGVYRKRLVDALAMCIAKGLDDLRIQHDVDIRPAELYLLSAKENLAGKLSLRQSRRLAALAKEKAAVRHVARARAFEAIRDASKILNPVTPEEFEKLVDQECAAADASYDAKFEAVHKHGYGGKFEAAAMIGLADLIPKSVGVPGLSESHICPQCAAPMSHSGVRASWVCEDGHEITDLQIHALRTAR